MRWRCFHFNAAAFYHLSGSNLHVSLERHEDLTAVGRAPSPGFWLFLPCVCGFSPGIPGNHVYKNNDFFKKSNLEQPLCTRGQYVTHGWPQQVPGRHVYREQPCSNLQNTAIIINACALHQKKSELPAFSSQKSSFLPAQRALRWLSGLFWAFVRTHCFWSYASEEEQRIRRASNPFLSFTYRHNSFFITPHLPLNLSRTKHWPHLMPCTRKRQIPAPLPSGWVPLIHWFWVSSSLVLLST